MSQSAITKPFTERLPSSEERQAATVLRQLIAKGKSPTGGEATLNIADPYGSPQVVVLPAAMSEVLLDLLCLISQGKAVTLVPMMEMLTTQRAADLLNVSRPYLIKQLEAGLIEHQKVGRHRRIKAEDLFEYRRQRDEKRRTALTELASLNGELE